MSEIDKAKLSRADFLKRSTTIIGSVIVAGSIFSACVEDQHSPPPIQSYTKPIEWRMVTTWPPQFSYHRRLY